jgi:nonsense-mediated mRNA decay protein 3
MDDLEADPVMRQGINIYRNPKVPIPETKVDVDDAGDEEAPRITLQEMLDELTLEDDPMGD